jgi:hypothetical protein
MLQQPELRKGHDRVRAQQGQNKRRHIWLDLTGLFVPDEVPKIDSV